MAFEPFQVLNRNSSSFSQIEKIPIEICIASTCVIFSQIFFRNQTVSKVNRLTKAVLIQIWASQNLGIKIDQLNLYDTHTTKVTDFSCRN